MPTIISPVDGSQVHQFEDLSPTEARAAIARARESQRGWAQTTLEHRRDVCRVMLDKYQTRLNRNAHEITMAMGKPLAQAEGEFTRGTRERTLSLVEQSAAALADTHLSPRPGFSRFVRRVPVGVVLDIAAWNYPLLVAVNALVPAVLSGNAVLIKHAPQTAQVARQFEEAFLAAGAPPALVQSFMVSHATVATLLAERAFDHVAFTGSVRGGREVQIAAAVGGFTSVGLELGGKDAAIVLEDADFESAVANTVDGAFYNAGQSCCAVERVLIHESIFDRFVEAFTAAAHTYCVGDPREPDTTMGPVVTRESAERIDASVRAAIAGGARETTDPSRFRVPDLSPCYRAPQVLVGVTPSMAIFREETFGPAIGLMPFKDDAHALSLANDSTYGLTASVWTGDLERATALAAGLEVGTVFMNRCDHLDPELPWTGTKDSGRGSTLSTLGFHAFTRPKSHHFRLA